VERIERAKQHDAEHVALPVAAAQAYYQIVGSTPQDKTVANLDRVLNRVARAITNVVPVHVPEGAGMRQLLPIELMQAEFRRGATVLVLSSGTELRGLTVRRGDAREAVAVLRTIHAKFDD
jgi:hypothetical protein